MKSYKWMASQINNGKNGRLIGIGHSQGYVLVYTYEGMPGYGNQSNPRPTFPVKGSAELNSMLLEMDGIAKTFVIK
jgi:hypothetical protein